MTALENRLHYPLGDQLPAPGDTLEVSPGVFWLRMGLPFALDHINLWLLRDVRDGVVGCLLYTSPSPRDRQKSRMPSSA